MLDVEVLGWCGYTWCEAGWMYAKLSETPLEMAYSIHGQQLWWTFLQSACQLHSPSKLATSVALLCDKTAHFRVAFYCGQPKVHLCNNHAV